MIASTGYAHDSWFWNWISGGLNYQIEHHLFPSICHVHYPMIAPIVKETCKEYGIEYTYYATFTDALRAHFALLYRMGNPVDSDSKKKSKKE